MFEIISSSHGKYFLSFLLIFFPIPVYSVVYSTLFLFHQLSLVLIKVGSRMHGWVITLSLVVPGTYLTEASYWFSSRVWVLWEQGWGPLNLCVIMAVNVCFECYRRAHSGICHGSFWSLHLWNMILKENLHMLTIVAGTWKMSNEW